MVFIGYLMLLSKGGQTLTSLSPLLTAWDPFQPEAASHQSTYYPPRPAPDSAPGQESQSPLPEGLPLNSQTPRGLWPQSLDRPCTWMRVGKKLTEVKAPADVLVALPARTVASPPCQMSNTKRGCPPSPTSTPKCPKKAEAAEAAKWS